ncbi:MAG: hypothetical protein ACYSUY_03640 [Planctomycetota bacterium]|jgi:hypothetical protein
MSKSNTVEHMARANEYIEMTSVPGAPRLSTFVISKIKGTTQRVHKHTAIPTRKAMIDTILDAKGDYEPVVDNLVLTGQFSKALIGIL